MHNCLDGLHHSPVLPKSYSTAIASITLRVSYLTTGDAVFLPKSLGTQSSLVTVVNSHLIRSDLKYPLGVDDVTFIRFLHNCPGVVLLE